MTDPFEYFDPSTAAKSHASKVEIVPSSHAGASAPHSGGSKSSPYGVPPSAPSANPYKPSGSSSAPQPHNPYVPPQPSKPAVAPHNPYAPAPVNVQHRVHGVPAPSKPTHAPNPRVHGNPYAPPAGAPSGASGNPYALPPQPSAPQGGFQGGNSKAQPVRGHSPSAPPSKSGSQALAGGHHPPPPSGLPASSAAHPPATRPMKFAEGPELYLADSDRQQFLDCGFVVLPNVVNADLRKKALQAINKSLGRIPIANRNTTSCPELVAAEPLLNLFHASGVASLASRLLGPGFHPPPMCFINLQYPGDGCIDTQQPNDKEGWNLLPENQYELQPLPHWSSYWKIDGLPAPAASPNDENHFIRNYSLMVAVFLSDNLEEMNGNITLWPGSHLGIQAMLRARGGTVAALKSGKIDRPVIQNNQLEAVPQQLTVRAGDVLLCHYQVAHTHAPNLGSDIRYVVYFRVYAKQHTPNTMRPEAMDNVFLDFEGIYDLIGKSHPK